MFHTGRYPDTDSALAAIDGTKDPPVRVLKQELAPSLYGCDISMLDIMIISKNYTASRPIDERTNALVRCLSTLSNRAEILSPVRVHIESLIQCMVESEATRLEYQTIKKKWMMKSMQFRQRERSRRAADILKSYGVNKVNLHLRKEELSAGSNPFHFENVPASSRIVPPPSLPLERISYCSIKNNRRKKRQPK